MKKSIQIIFTKLRNALNNREDELLLEVDNKYKKFFFDENIIKKGEKLPHKINLSLKKGKLLKENLLKNKKLNSIIYDCIKIESNIQSIKEINKKIKNCGTMNDDIILQQSEEDVNLLLNELKTFGSIGNKKIDSKIGFSFNLIKSWIDNREFNLELLYRKTRDGSEPQNFHDKCDNKENTMILIETTKGYKFGGYTELDWNGNNKEKEDKQTFLFSLNNKKKYISTNKQG